MAFPAYVAGANALLGASAGRMPSFLVAHQLLQFHHPRSEQEWLIEKVNPEGDTVRGSVMRMFVLAAVIAAASALGGCFHFHQSQVYTAPQPLPPLK